MFFVLKYLLLLAILPIILVPSFGQLVPNQPIYPSTGFTFCVTTESNSNIILLDGNTDYVSTDITFRITSPSGNNVTDTQISPRLNGDYMTELQITPSWDEDGFYTITVVQHTGQNPSYILNIKVEVNNMKTSETLICVGSYHTVEPIETISSLTITTDKPSYTAGETIQISGEFNNTHNGTSLNLSLQYPDGNYSTIPNITTNNNSYTTSIPTGNNTSISTPGTYTIISHYGTNTASTTFDYYSHPVQSYNESFIPDESYLILSDQQITKWNGELTKWQNAQIRTDNQTELYYEKLDEAISKNQTNRINLFTEKIGHSMALSSLYDGLIQCLQEQLELFS